jgi:hypothetical protein
MDKVIVTIKRGASLKEGTFGMILYNGKPFAVTGERPWKDNQKNISCIPVGIYLCKRYSSDKYPDTFEVVNVPGRTHILFHKGNFPLKDSKGCILIAEKFEDINDDVCVLESNNGFSEFLSKLKGVNTFILQIVEVKT